MAERDEAIEIANIILDEPSRDPDDEFAILARQFLRAVKLAAAPDLAEFGSLADELRARRSFMVSRGYRFCSIPACNCNSWHGGHSEARLQEIDNLLDRYGVEHNGLTLHEAIEGVIRSAGYTE